MSLVVLQSWVIQTGLMISLLIFVILIIRRSFARAFGANAAYALWSLPLIRLCLPVLSVPEKWIPQFLRPRLAEVSETVTEVAAPSLPQMENISGALKVPAAATSFSLSLGSILLLVWASVAVLWLALQLFQQRKFKTYHLENSLLPGESLTEEIKITERLLGLKNTPQVRVSKTNIGPLVTGVVNPVIILPKTFEADFDVDQRGFALTHEFAHLKRKDLWAALAALIFRAVNWPNPLVHYAAHRLRADQEAACDAYVVRLTGGDAVHSYAETLVKAARQSADNRANNGHLALSLADKSKENLKGD